MNTALFYGILIYFALGAVVPGQSKQERHNKLFVRDSFEQLDFAKNWKGAEKCCSYSMMRSDSIAREGKYSLRLELNLTDDIVAGSKRVELRTANEKKANVERWYKFSTYFPQDYALDAIPEIIAQWHENPDFDLGEKWRSPPIALEIIKGKWQVRVLSASEKVNTNKTLSSNNSFDIEDFKAGTWHDWIFHIHFSFEEDGLIQVWHNGKLVVDHAGPNYYNDKKGPYFKIGLYKWGWKAKNVRSAVARRVLYIDDVKIGGENMTYDLMKK